MKSDAARRLNRDEVVEICRLVGCEDFVSKCLVFAQSRDCVHFLSKCSVSSC